MGEIVAGMATSHAFTLVDPSDWDRQRELNRTGDHRRYGAYPPVQPAIEAESDAVVEDAMPGCGRRWSGWDAW